MENKNKEGDLRVVWIPQLGMETPFYVSVEDMTEAMLILNT